MDNGQPSIRLFGVTDVSSLLEGVDCRREIVLCVTSLDFFLTFIFLLPLDFKERNFNPFKLRSRWSLNVLR
jgi:hypothetical protein